MSVPILRLSGTPRDRGRMHGALCEAAIHERISRVFAERYRGMAPSVVRERLVPRAKAFEAEATLVAPHLVEEIHGIAEGASLDLLDTMILSAFEILQADGAAADLGCTAVGIHAGGRCALGQNWDAGEDHSRYLLILDVEISSGMRQLILTSAGGLGWCGMNSRGLGVVNNDLVLRGTRIAPPSQVVRRLLLERETVLDCVDLLARLPSPGGRSYVVADRGGTLAAIEVTATTRPQVTLSRGAMWHTNHAERDLVKQDEDLTSLARLYPSSAARSRRVEELLACVVGDPTRAVMDVLRDHQNFPLSICKHASPVEPSVTAASVVFDLTAPAGYFVVGQPCAHRFLEIAF